MRTYIAESVYPEDFFERRWEGHVVEEIVRLLHGRAFYRIVMTSALLDAALGRARKRDCDVFHLSCHGDESGICLTDGTDLSWDELALKFRDARYSPSVLVLSSCLAGDRGAARAFRNHTSRPAVIFGTEGDGDDKIRFPGACITWPMLYTELLTQGMEQSALRSAVNKMNRVTAHQFVYWRWNDDSDRYLRYPPRE